jgi:AbiV family abortive infection protein
VTTMRAPLDSRSQALGEVAWLHRILYGPVERTDAVGASLRMWRSKILENALLQLRGARGLLEKGNFPVACLLSMTAIEEAGKLPILIVTADRVRKLIGADEPTSKWLRRVQRYLRDHPEKARQAATWSLMINAGADRRQGTHPGSGISRTSGVILLVRSGQWMALRNSCLYVDLSASRSEVVSPREAVTMAHTYYMICMAHEVVAGQATAAFDDVASGLSVEDKVLSELEQFMTERGSSVDVDSLDFLANPWPLRREAERREARAQAKS